MSKPEKKINPKPTSSEKLCHYYYIIHAEDLLLEHGYMLHEKAWVLVTEKYGKEHKKVIAAKYDNEEDYKKALSNYA